ncbi:MAG: hypothetical protein LUC48_03930 [Clostridiales bacterium]|nr:hypothetical protein [Clostridiales bacterium]
MGNKKVQKVSINKERFLEVLHLRNCSIRKLGNAYEEIGRTEKTIRRCLDAGEMSPDLLNRIAKYLNVHPDYLSGKYDEQADRIEDSYLRAMFKSFINPERYPYLLKARSDIEYKTYFENILNMNDISMEQFHELPPEERILFHKELVVAILEVISKHFTRNALGQCIADELDDCKSSFNEFDPFSYYAELEGIGIPEPNFIDDADDKESREFEKRMSEKYNIKD